MIIEASALAYVLYLIGAVGLFVFILGLGNSWDNSPHNWKDWVSVIAVGVFWPIVVFGWLMYVLYSIFPSGSPR
jgi:hypothetical protein